MTTETVLHPIAGHYRRVEAGPHGLNHQWTYPMEGSFWVVTEALHGLEDCRLAEVFANWSEHRYGHSTLDCVDGVSNSIDACRLIGWTFDEATARRAQVAHLVTNGWAEDEAEAEALIKEFLS